MKKGIFTILAVLTVFALVMTGCPTTDSGEKPNPPKPPVQASDTVRFNYNDGTVVDIKFVAGETTWADILGNKKYKKKGDDRFSGDTKVFKAWKDQSGDAWTDATATIQTMLTLSADWYNNTVTNDGTALEKLQLENAGKAIYEFDLGANQIADYSEFQVTYKVSEYAVEKNQTNLRVYQYRALELTTAAADADGAGLSANLGFKVDPNGVKFLDNNQFNQGARMICNDGRDKAINGDDVKAKLVGSTAVVADTWFTLKSAVGATPATLGTVPFGTTGKVYFGLGLPTNAGARDANTYAPVWGVHAPILQLVKDVKLIHKTDATKNITATIPTGGLPLYMAYADPGGQVFCWRGSPSASVATPPELVPPPPPVPEAEDDYTYNFAGKTLTLYQSDSNSDGTKVITITGNAISIDLTVANGGWNPGNGGEPGGKFGGGGFKILFDTLALPDVGGVKDYRAYGEIVLNCTVSGLEGSASNPNQVNFRKIGSNSNISVSKDGGTAGGYIGLTAATSNFSFPTSALSFTETDTEIGFVVIPNNWAQSNLPWKGTITVNNIKFIAP